MVAFVAVVGAVAGAVAAAGATYEAAKKLAREFERSIVIEVKNGTDEAFQIEGTHHSSGGFGTAPPRTLQPRQSIAFSSQSSFGVGAVGNMRLVSRDIWLGMSWHNPVIGSNEFRSSENGPRAGEFLTSALARSGNHAEFEYVIAYRDPSRVQQVVQSLTLQTFAPIVGGFPHGAAAVGHEADRTPLFLGRASFSGGVHPGKARADWSSVAISYGGREEWASHGAAAWLGRVPNGSGGAWLPPDRAHNAFAVGQEADGTPLYAARCHHAGGVHIGKWRRDWTAASVSYGGQELWLAPLEVLCTR